MGGPLLEEVAALQSVRAAAYLPISLDNHPQPGSFWLGESLVEYTAFLPKTFRELRTMHGLNAEEFAREWEIHPDDISLAKGAGRSGSKFQYSANKKYLIKSLLKPEVKAVEDILPSYYQYLVRNGSSLIARMFMMLQVKVGRKKSTYIIQQNIADPAHIPGMQPMVHDLKGRFIKPGKQSKNRAAGSSVLKDNDVDHHFEMEASKLEPLMRQIVSDTEFLATMGMLDYSLYIASTFKPQRPSSAPIGPAGRSMFQSEYGGIVSGNKVLFIGIIDILTAYTAPKKVANFCKSLIWTELELSTVPPDFYATRFLDYMHQLWLPAGADSNYAPTAYHGMHSAGVVGFFPH